MNPHVVIINGFGGSGKDTFVEMFSSIDRNSKIKNWSSIDMYRKIAEIYFGMDPKDKSDKNRQLLSDLKKIGVRYDDLPFKEAKDTIETFHGDILFMHIREPGEIRKIRYLYPQIVTLLVKNINVDVPNTDSDKMVDDFIYDYIIENNGDLDHLLCEAETFRKYLFSKEPIKYLYVF